MRNRNLLYILIPLIIVVLIIIAGVVFVALNSSPEKIFEHSISKVFGMFETSEENFSTMRGTMNLTANIESDNEQMEAINTLLDGTGINLDMQADTANMVINEKLSVIFNNENLLNASVLLQDQKGYAYLPDYIDKYLELPEEDMEYSDLTEYYEKMSTLDQNALMEAIKEELITAISNQELVQEKTTLTLDGQETKVTASTLSLKDAQMTAFYSEFFGNLNKNEKFLVALGTYKEDVQTAINGMLLDMEDAEDVGLEITIYTKGFLNEFVGISGKAIDYYFEEVTGLELLKHNDGKYEFTAYSEYGGERKEALKLIIEDNKESKNKGTATITITVEEEQFIIKYNYEKQGNQNSFVASTEVEGVGLSISGNAVEEGKNIKGNFVISVQEETLGKANLNCAYNFTYDVEVQKVDVGNAVLIDELSEDDQTTLMTNLQNSPLYQLIEQSGLLDTTKDYCSDYDESYISAFAYTIKYNIPEGFEACEDDSSSYEKYIDDNYNSILIAMDWKSVDSYLNNLENSNILTSYMIYENQKISDIKSMNVNGKEYKFRTLTYNDVYGGSYVDLYFAYELDDEYCYVVQVTSEGGNISMETIKYFLDVTVSKNPIQNAIDSEENLGSGNVYINGGETVNVNDIINMYN